MATRTHIDQNLLSDLVERRIESPEVEYKNWIPLTDSVERAKIARHICALANGGGGWLVFGFEDDGSPAAPHPGNLSAYDQDAINGIGARYLQPQPHCEVHRVKAASGLEYAVIRVPSHGSVPICAKSDGPQEKGAPQGIRKGVHYVRAPGPKSVPIDSPQLWQEVLRRCVLAERAGLLESIGQLFDRPQPVTDGPGLVETVLDHALGVWETMTADGWPILIGENRVGFAFRFLDGNGNSTASLPLTTLNHAIRGASSASADAIRGGASFEAGWDLETKARVTVVEGREGYYAQRTEGTYTLPTYWFVRDDGVGVEVTAIPEDSRWTREAVEGRGRTRPWPHGERLAPTFQIDMAAQRIAFVRTLAESYPDAVHCQFVIDYLGLAGRQLDEPAPGVYFSISRSCTVNARRVPITIGIATLTAEIAEVTAALIGPIFRLFDGWDVGADHVRARLERR